MRNFLVLMACALTAHASEKTDQKMEAAYLDTLRVGIPGGVTHSPARDQKSAENCWAFTMCGLIEGEYHKAFAPANHLDDLDKRGYVRLSPFYLSFYHYYFQIRDNVPYFDGLREQLKDPTNASLREQVEKSYARMKTALAHAKKEAEKKEDPDLFKPDVGSYESIAMREISEVGAMPLSQFQADIDDDEKENRFENVIPDLLRRLVFDASDPAWQHLKSHLRYGKNIGVEDPLFEALSAALVPTLNPRASVLAPLPANAGPEFSFPVRDLKRIPTPTTRFSYLNLLTNQVEEYTPREFLAKWLKFNPHKFRSFVMTPDNIDQSLAAIQDNLRSGYATPIGVQLYDDVSTEKNRDKRTAKERATDTGVFDERFCAGPPGDAAEGDDFQCRGGTEGHEMLGVNWAETKRGKIAGVVVKNSWGDAGLDVNARSPSNEGYDEDPLHHGYYLLNREWLRSGTNAAIFGEGVIDFVLHSSVAERHRRDGLVPERVRNKVDRN